MSKKVVKRRKGGCPVSGKELARLCRLMGSQRAVAEKFGVGRATVNKWLRKKAKNDPSLVSSASAPASSADQATCFPATEEDENLLERNRVSAEVWVRKWLVKRGLRKALPRVQGGDSGGY